MSASHKVVLVTGCSAGGIGFALCEEFAARGCKVYATARRVQAMEGFKHENIQRLQLDVTSEENISTVVQTIVNEEGKIDIVVNNAGVPCHGPLIDVPIDTVQRVFETNVFSILRVSRAVIPYMASRKSGTIVNIGSIAGEITTPWSGIYSATKACVERFSESLYMECQPFNISVVHISPGGVTSNIAQNMLTQLALPPDSLYKPYVDAIIMRVNVSQQRAMSAEEFARRVVGAAIAHRPPRYMTLGTSSFLFAIFKWLPRGWVLGRLWKTFGWRSDKAA
ncbi:NADPH-dependent 1-acyldihydroxyacetone phosphate reductase [Sparassis crispa]|uniref:NADPH-dependent 1-acyldihydroxyacetone phosphate reductase n=1 Tax=Sparassis crispa TaxID=139825 RepID=A0A401GEX3_9APHY|nr:NADPH-dependent 1-acyldihydroxyacetone phosphate reductase [Sparassis crispa]GBE80727.1 NADPH-dependent 1-acyldihydroxyacetone phosphate reductase [Sparassis crispa]